MKVKGRHLISIKVQWSNQIEAAQLMDFLIENMQSFEFERYIMLGCKEICSPVIENVTEQQADQLKDFPVFKGAEFIFRKSINLSDC